MFESFLKKNFWQSLFTATAGSSGRTKFTFEELRALSDVLNKNQVVTESNRALVVETIRSIAEFMIWGDQNEPRIFDYFLENNIMHYLHRVLQQPANRTGDVAKQVLQTLSIIIQNVRSETGTYFLFSNNHINNIVEIRFDFEDEEVLGYYISFLKTISLKLNARTVQFFFDRRESTYTFPLYSEAVKFAHHKEGMVRAGVRTLTLNVYSVPDEYIQDYVCQPTATAYFAEMAAYIADQIKILDKRMVAAEGFSAQVLSSLDSQLAEVEDMMSYVADILTTAHPRLAHLVAEQLWVSLVGPYLLRPLLEYGSKSVAQSNSGARRTSASSGTVPGSPGSAGASPPIVRTACSLYCLERLFVLITYAPLLHNLALALLDPRVGHPSCRSALVSVLRSEDHRAVPAALRCLVAVVHNRRIAPEVLALLGMVPRARSADAQVAVTGAAGGSDCGACRLDEQLPPLPQGCPAAGAPPDPLAEEPQPVVTAASSGAAAAGGGGGGGGGGSASVFAYHVLWTDLERASEWVLAQRGYGGDNGREGDAGGAAESSQGEVAVPSEQAEPGALGSRADSQSEAAAGDQQTLAAASEQDLMGHYLEGATFGGGDTAASSRAASLGLGGGGGADYDAAEPTTRASDVDLLGLGDDAGASDVRSSQPVSRQQTGREADLLGFESMLGTGLAEMLLAPAPAPTAVPDGAAVIRGVPVAAAGVPEQAPAAGSAPAPPGTAAAADALAGPLADLLDLGADDLVALSAAPSSSTVLTPVASVGAALGAVASLGTAASGHLLDTLLEPSSSGPAQQEPRPSNAALAAAGAADQPETAGWREAATHAPAAATTSEALGGVGVGALPEAGKLGAAADVAAAEGRLVSEPVDPLGALSDDPGPAASLLQSSGSSSALGSAAAGDSFAAGTTLTSEALADASASATPSSTALVAGGSGSGRHGTAGADTESSSQPVAPIAASENGPEAASAPPPPPPAAPLPPPAAPAPLLAFSPACCVCASHARPAAMCTSTDLLDALFALLSMQLLPVTGLWHVAHLLQQLYPRAQEQRELDQQLAQLLAAEAAVEPAVADLLNLDLDAGGAEVGSSAVGAAAAGAAAAAAPPAPQPPSPPHPLDPSSTAGWACELSGAQREALRVAAVSAASAVLDEVGGMWCDALVAMLVAEWPLAHDAITAGRPVLRTAAEQLMAGPHLYPHQTARGLSGASRNDQGLSGSAVAALHSYHAVARLVALLLVHDLLCRGATERTPPATVPPPPGADAEGREWDVAEGQEVELQAGSAIPCIVSFAPGQERRVYFAAAGPALRRVAEYLQNPQALLSDPSAQSAVLHSSPAVVLAEPAPTRLNAGHVLSVSPLLGSDPSVDRNVAKWLHVHVRPSVRGLLRLLRSAAGGRKGGLLGALRHLVDGHWVLAFPDSERAANARQLVEESVHRLRALVCELLSPVLSSLME
ncbi:hypothetical protein PLESTB_001465900 [Pleodorina starrii]|uniref:FPL domain-containing protein n=1 Tax=Pleodorina starrii TaxID=330485 RepID=A0A9W6BWV2_9CHLO|nr:hypothetical protein PLESTM_001684100 [Pleodorina starrii]GLC59245.1 hypothetical protein PLESTB_001465900 [Pleodorina starrii]GLC74810.1 hypothetical protein PLESTF_001558500 [Pleodorina starrii]